MKFTQFRKNIGIVIGRARKKKKMSQADLAFLVGVSRTSITNAEKGRQLLPFNRMILLCHLLDLNINSLINSKYIKDTLKEKKRLMEKLRELEF